MKPESIIQLAISHLPRGLNCQAISSNVGMLTGRSEIKEQEEEMREGGFIYRVVVDGKPF